MRKWIVLIVNALILSSVFVPGAEFALTITSAPENPFLVLEGSNITLVWQYNLGGTFSNLFFRLPGSPPVQVVDKFDINEDALIPGAYKGRIQENVTTSHTAITFLDVHRSDSGKYEFEIFTKPPPSRDRTINETVITVR